MYAHGIIKLSLIITNTCMGGACNKLTQEGDGAALPKLTCQAFFCFWGNGFQTEAIITGPVLHYIRMLVLDAEWADILLILHEKKMTFQNLYGLNRTYCSASHQAESGSDFQPLCGYNIRGASKIIIAE